MFMTLIVTVATPCFVMQAGDRLLTREIAEEDYEIYDANSNKNVIYEASDGLLTISYAGIAFINRQPTDEWLAHLLQPTVRNLFEGCHDPYGFSVENLASCERFSVNEVLKVLRTSLRNLASSTVSRHGLVVTVAGWRSIESLPVLVEIRRLKGSPRLKVDGFKHKLGKKENSV